MLYRASCFNLDPLLHSPHSIVFLLFSNDENFAIVSIDNHHPCKFTASEKTKMYKFFNKNVKNIRSCRESAQTIPQQGIVEVQHAELMKIFTTKQRANYSSPNWRRTRGSWGIRVPILVYLIGTLLPLCPQFVSLNLHLIFYPYLLYSL